MEVDFRKEFINIDFDAKLLENNNHLINSQDHYVSYKQKYIKNTLNNFGAYTKLMETYMQIQNKTSTTDFKVFFTYVDDSEVTNLKHSIKTIILHQRKMLYNFLLYIEYLNANANLLQPQNVQKPKRRFQLFKK
jgi:hypothetical protein